MVHLQREAQQHEGIADHGRVEQVAPDTAKGLFADTDGNAGGDHRQPPRGQGRQGGRQQHGGYQRTAVIQRCAQWLRAQGQQQCFAQQRGTGTQQEVQQHPPAMQPEQRQQARHTGQQHQAHAGA
ncbi:hypothetical protein D3C76_976270 [compost metagenome]